jgi:Family of unknown function (DUF6476)
VRTLKILVIVMAVLILAGSATLIVVIAGRLSRGGPGAPTQPFAAAPIELPAGARLETMSVGSDRLVLEIVLPDGNRRLVIIDLATGRQLGAIPLRTAP